MANSMLAGSKFSECVREERRRTESWRRFNRSVPLVRVDQHLDGTVRGGSPNGGDQAPVSVTNRAWSSRPSRPHVAPTLRPKRYFGEGCWSSGSMLVSRGRPATREEAQDVLSAWWENACARPRSKRLAVMRRHNLKKASSLHSTNIWPCSSFGAVGMGDAPSTVQGIRSRAADAVCPKSGRCVSSIAIGLPHKADPAVQARFECVKQWLVFWHHADEFARTRVRRAWRLSLEQLRDGSSRWIKVRSPMRAVMCVLFDAGWFPLHSTYWMQAEGEGACWLRPLGLQDLPYKLENFGFPTDRFLGDATDRHARNACLRFFSLLFFPVFLASTKKTKNQKKKKTMKQLQKTKTKKSEKSKKSENQKKLTNKQ